MARPTAPEAGDQWAYGVEGPRVTMCTVPVLGPDAIPLGVFGVTLPGDGEHADACVDLANQYAALASVAIRNDQREASLVRSQQALREAQQVGRFGDLTVTVDDGVMVWSQQTYELYGLPAREREPSIAQFAAWHEGTRVHDLVMMLRGDGPDTCDFEVPVRRDSEVVGHHRFVLSRRPGDGDSTYVTGTVHDVTERRRSEEALAQTQRLEGLGLLAGGIAHDFNNLLAALLANVGLLERHIGDDPVSRRIVGSIDRVVHRAADLTRQILTYAGRSRPATELVEIDELVGELASILRSTAHDRVKLSLELGADDAATTGDPAQLQQVVMNLITNAIDAIGDKPGRIVVRTRSMLLTPEMIAARFPGQSVLEGRYVELSVADDGCGMSMETASRIFDPFFTTKPTGRGLGLSAVRGILKSHGAAVHIDSAIGRGTTFRIVFPEHRGSTSAPPAMLARQRASGRILLVEDEDDIRLAMHEDLAAAGYEVESVSDCALAVDRLACPPAFDAVISDLRMPRGSGLEVFEALRASSETTAFVMCTGFRGDADLHRLDVDVYAAVVEKPSRIPDLRVLVERLRARR